MAFGGFFNGLAMPGGHFGRRPSTLAQELIRAYGDDPNTSIPQLVRPPAGVTAPGAQLPMPPQQQLPVPTQQTPMPYEQMGGLGGALLKASGLDTSQLPYEQQQQVAKQLMLKAGLAMMQQAYNPQGWNNSVGAGLTAGLSAVAGQGEGISEKMTRKALMDRLGKIEGNDIGALQQLAMDALRAGDTEIAQKAGYLIMAIQQGQYAGRGDTIPSAARPQQGGTAIGPDGKEYKTIFDPTMNEGQGGYRVTDIVVDDGTTSPGKDTNLQKATFAVADPATGEVEVVQGSYDPASGQYYDSEGNAAQNVVAKPPAVGATEGELKAAGYLVILPRHLETLDNASSPSFVEKYMGEDGLLRAFNPEDQKLMEIAAKAVTEVHLRLTTGAAFNDLEYQNALDLYVPQPGDTAAILAYKKANRDELAQMAQQRAGRALPAAPAAPASDNPSTPTGQKTRPVPRRP